MEDYLIKTIRKGSSDKQMICFPYVGACWFAFRDFVQAIEMDMEIIGINPPGHGPNQNTLLTNINEMADLYFTRLLPHFKSKVIFFGYSMGALIVYQILDKIREAQGSLKDFLFIIAASNPPHITNIGEKKSRLSDEDFFTFIKSLGGITKELEREKELIQFFLPILRADYKAVENFSITTASLENPVYVLYGKEDHFATNKNSLEWQRYFKNKITMVSVTGGHLFIKDYYQESAQIIEKIIHESF